MAAKKTNSIYFTLSLILLISFPHFSFADLKDLKFFDYQTNLHHGKSGVFILEKGEQALLARAWLADHAEKSIEVQYFIWSTDNVGVLATEALLRAADRGVKVRVVVDDLLIDSPDEVLLALSNHKNVEIRIYNPKHSVGTSFIRRLINIITDFRSVNQRMHDKTFIVDDMVAITGGRNMADEYFDYNRKYNFRDRDALVIGPVVTDIKVNFTSFWRSQLSVLVEDRFDESNYISREKTQKIYKQLHEYAQSTENFEPEVKDAIKNLSSSFDSLSKNIEWGDVKFISDDPGKNNNQKSFGAGGKSSSELALLIKNAKSSILIQSPYLILSENAEKLFHSAIKRGVSITISTNSLASTDNLQAFSGYLNQRESILNSGISVFEYKPFPKIQMQLLERYPRLKNNHPIFALHAKTMVIDSKILFVGTYNLDPRSENLNTEVGIVINNARLAKEVTENIKVDMREENSWNALNNPNQHSTIGKRLQVFFYQLLPLKPIL